MNVILSLVCGGIGITPCLFFLEKMKSYFEQGNSSAQQAAEDRLAEKDDDHKTSLLSHAREVTLIFTARDIDLVYLVSDKLLHFSDYFSKVKINIRIFLTGDMAGVSSGDGDNGLKLGVLRSESDQGRRQASFKLLQEKSTYFSLSNRTP